MVHQESDISIFGSDYQAQHYISSVAMQRDAVEGRGFGRGGVGWGERFGRAGVGRGYGGKGKVLTWPLPKSNPRGTGLLGLVMVDGDGELWSESWDGDGEYDLLAMAGPTGCPPPWVHCCCPALHTTAHMKHSGTGRREPSKTVGGTKKR